MMTIEEEMILNRVATALETIARQKMGAEPVKADEELEDVYADEVLEWMDKFPPEMRDCIRATAYHFINVGVKWNKEQKPVEWKPTKEQMASLKEVAYSLVGTGTKTDVHLVQLYEQLKRIKED